MIFRGFGGRARVVCFCQRPCRLRYWGINVLLLEFWRNVLRRWRKLWPLCRHNLADRIGAGLANLGATARWQYSDSYGGLL